MQLPPYASSTLRGIFGHALRHRACVTRAAHCEGCALIAHCAYPPLFEPQHAPKNPDGLAALAPYAIETTFGEVTRYRQGDDYAFDMVLMTPKAIAELPLIVAAWKRAFALGVGPKDGTAELIKLEHIATVAKVNSIYNTACEILSTDSTLKAHNTALAIPQFSEPAKVHLHVQTPLRIMQQRQLIGTRELTPSIFLRHLIRRVSVHVNAQRPGSYSLDTIRQLNQLADQVSSDTCQLNWHDWTRRSSRQQHKMALGGLMGHWHLQRVPAELLPFIYLGQWLHVGKETAFGLGHYQWVNQSQ
ncbi:MAG: CRISPR system precrRNA processing endoribonuclease RAMP protein Cas6 [Gammaproteobacteria bacterium]|nr:CRISPR system precrRNA processing endoribonuclease RAMP protein Cas6 [Gammaproteobacteria bacterium]